MSALLLGIAVAVLPVGHLAVAENAPAPARVARPAAPQRPRTVVVEAVQGASGSEAARAALREAIARHVRRQGFHVMDDGKAAAYRLRPTVITLESGGAGAGTVEVKASLVALDRKGRVAAMVEGGARASGAAPGSATAVVEAQAIEAAARSIAEDLARRLLEAR